MIPLLLMSGILTSSVHAQERLEELGRMYLDRTDEFGSYSWGIFPDETASILDDASWSPEVLLWRGEQKIDVKQLGEARVLMSTLVDRYPNTYSATVALLDQGIIAIENKAYGRARIYFDEAIIKGTAAQTPEGENLAGTALYLIAYTHALEGEQPVENTVDLLKEFIEHYPGNPLEADALYMLGEIAEMRGDNEEAIKYYDQVVARQRSTRLSFEARNHRAQSLARLSRYQDAQEELAAIERDLYGPEGAALDNETLVEIRSDCMLLRGEIEIALGNYSAAEQAFVSLMNGSELYRRKGYLGLADTYQAAGRNDSALAIYTRLIAEDTADAVFRKAEFNRALALRGLGREGEAASVFESIGRDSSHVMNDRALVELAMIHYRSREYQAAAEALDRAIAQAHDDRTRIRAYTIKGVVELGEGEPEKAIKSFEMAEKFSARVKDYRGSDLAEAKLLSGITLARTNRPAEAIPTLNRFLDGYPTHGGRDEAMYWLGESYYQSGLYKASVDVLEDLIEQHPGSNRVPDAMYLTGWAEFRQRRFDRADAAFSQLVKAFPTSGYVVEAQLRRGDAFYLAKRYDEAIRTYRQIEKLNPTPDEATHAAYQGALAHMQLGELDLADTLFQKFTDCYATADLAQDALYRCGEIAFRQGEYSRAVAMLNALLGRGAREDLLPGAYGTLGDAHLRLGNTHLAGGAYSIVLDRFPKSSFAGAARDGITGAAGNRKDENGTSGCGNGDYHLGTGRAQIYLDTYHPADALREYRALDAAGEGTCRPHLWLGIARSHLAAGDTKEGMDTLRLLLSRYPDGEIIPAALLALGEAMLRENDTATATGYFEQLRGAYPDSSISIRARLHLAEIYSRSRRIDTAQVILYENLSRFPNSTLAAWSWLGLAHLDTTSGRRDTVLAHLRTLAEGNDTLGAEAMFLLARMAAEGGRIPESIGMLEDLAERFRGETRLTSRALLAMGEAYQRAGEQAKAKEAYQMILQRYCDEKLRKQAEEYLQALNRL